MTRRRPRILEDAGPGALRGVLLLTVLAGIRAASLILIAESVAGSVVSLAAGEGVATGGIVLGIGGVLLRAGASWATTTVAGRIAARAKVVWRERLTARISGEGSAATAEETLLATRGLDDLDAYLGTVLPVMVAALVIPVALGLRILLLDPLSALIVAVTVPLIPVFMILIGLHTRDRAEAANGALLRLAGHLVELARGLPVLVGLGRAGEQTAALAAIQDGYRRRLDRTVRTALLSALALELIATLSVAVVAVTLGIRLLSGSASLDVALVVLILAPECFAAIREVGTAYHQSRDGAGALRRIRAVLERVVHQVVRTPGRPALHALTIRYPGRAAIGPISVALPTRGMVVFDGRSGAGKSAILDAICGVAAREAVVTGTIEGLDRAELAAARQAPRFAAATPREELRIIGRGHDDLLGELGLGGVADAPTGRLSPGEQRRVAIARALARVDAGASVLVLDEPTAHLDAVSARLVMDALAARRDRVLTIVASHDRAVHDLADLVVPIPGSASPSPAVAWTPDEIVADTSIPARRAGDQSAPHDAARGRAVLTWVGAILLGATASGMGLALTAVSGWLIVRAAEQPAIMYLLVAIVGVRFFGLGRAVARYAERVTGHAAAVRLVDRIRLRLWTRLAEQGAAARAAHDSGHALDLLVLLPAELRDLLARVLTPLVGGVVVVVATGATIVAVAPSAWPIAVMLVGAVVASSSVAWLADRRSQSAGVALRSELTRRFAAFCDAADDLRANGAASSVAREIDALGHARERQERRQIAVVASVPLIGGMLSGLPAVVAPLFVPSAGLAAVASLLALAVLEPIAGAAAAAQRLPALTAVVDRLRSGFGPYAPRGAATARLARPLRTLGGAGVTLAWTGGGPVVEHLGFQAVSPEWLVIDGPSGSGKSTLVTALLGDLVPTTGQLTADGVDLASVDREVWRTRMAWCPQEAHVFDSTIRANLLLARPREDAVGEKEMHDVLAAVGLDHLVREAERGLDLRVGSAGRSLSGGERQRLAVARALLRRGDALVLDEPTAHLDDATADAMMTDLRRATADRLVVLVSHRDGDRRAGDRMLSLPPARDLVLTAPPRPESIP